LTPDISGDGSGADALLPDAAFSLKYPDYRAPVLFTGACRSGKSAMALRWAEGRQGRKLYLATAAVLDEEMRLRVAAHQAARGRQWRTVEAAGRRDLAGLLDDIAGREPGIGAIVLDCTTLWLAGLMEQGLDDASILDCVDRLAAFCRASPPFALGVVHNETGWGLVPEYPLGRRFRDVSGLAGQKLAEACRTVVLAVCGLPVAIKGL
jgi:adenosylcobinamide kinase/adenosylcobinamide-phosphate guanylyltransferase